MKKYYKDLIRYEVYLGKKRNLFQRFYMRFPGLGKNVNFMIRKIQDLNENNSSKLGFLRWRLYRSKFEKRYGCFIAPNVTIGKGLILPHPNGIVFGKGLTIGNNCTIYQQVTFGGKEALSSYDGDIPTVGNDCIIYAGAKVLGKIIVADGTIVGANSVLMTDTVPNGVYVGSPARLVKIHERNISEYEEKINGKFTCQESKT